VTSNETIILIIFISCLHVETTTKCTNISTPIRSPHVSSNKGWTPTAEQEPRHIRVATKRPHGNDTLTYNTNSFPPPLPQQSKNLNLAPIHVNYSNDSPPVWNSSFDDYDMTSFSLYEDLTEYKNEVAIDAQPQRKENKKMGKQ